MAHSVDDILERLGGAEAVSRLTGVGAEAIRKWRQARAIPPKHWASLSSAAGIAINELPRAVTEAGAAPAGATAALVLADGTVFWGTGFGANTPSGGGQPAEICFNTGMTGYQETLTDPSYAGQVIVFTFPHIGNVGANAQDIEATTIAARGLVIKQDVTEPSNWRATETLNTWLRRQNVPGIAGVDTRALTARIRDSGAPNGVLCFPADGRFDLPALHEAARAWPGLEGMDLAQEVSCRQTFTWDATTWTWPDGFAKQDAPTHHVVAVDYGAKRNILRSLAAAGCRVTVVPATSSAEDILAHKPDGVFLSNGPGDPAAVTILSCRSRFPSPPRQGHVCLWRPAATPMRSAGR